MDGLPVFVWAVVLLLAYIAGSLMERRASSHEAKFQAELREDRARLKAENDRLGGEVIKLKEQILELRQQLNVALEEIARLSSRLEPDGGT